MFPIIIYGNGNNNKNNNNEKLNCNCNTYESDVTVSLKTNFSHFLIIFIMASIAFSFFIYDADIMMILKLTGFLIICYATSYLVSITAPIFLFFSVKYYDWLLTLTGLENNYLALTIYMFFVFKGVIQFIVFIFVFLKFKYRTVVINDFDPSDFEIPDF